MSGESTLVVCPSVRAVHDRGVASVIRADTATSACITPVLASPPPAPRPPPKLRPECDNNKRLALVRASQEQQYKEEHMQQDFEQHFTVCTQPHNYCCEHLQSHPRSITHSHSFARSHTRPSS